jgi:sigma-70-like protein
MTPLDDLPAEQRAVLELVLKRGRTYDEIAALLSIDRAGVRQRALTGLDALGPSTSVPPERRALITDYLLGQLPERVSEQVAQRLATEASDRAWARVIASELSPVAATPLPRIPTGAELPEAEPEGPGADENGRNGSAVAPAPAAGADMDPSGGDPAPPASAQPAPRSSRLGGAILLGVGALIVVAVVILVVALNSGSSKSPTTTSTSASTPGSTTSSLTAPTSTASTGAAASTGTGTGTTGTTPQSLATVKLTPVAPGSKAQGVAEAFKQSGVPYLAIVAINLAPNSHNFYAVWLTNSPTDSELLGFAPAVTSAGRLQAAKQLKTTDSRYKTLVVTLETQPHPKTPGTTVLSGAFAPKSL